MKTQLFSVSLLAASLFICEDLCGQTRENRDVSGFSNISFEIPGNLVIRTGPQFRLVLEGPGSNLKDIETKVSGGRLVIRKVNRWSSFRNDNVTVSLTLPQVEGLSVSGSGRAEISGPIKTHQLSLNVSGSGKVITGDLETDRLECSISGSGDIILRSGGSAEKGEITISGSGSFSGENVRVANLDVGVSGSGSCKCHATRTLNAKVSGSGRVIYAGDPEIDARVSGSGRVMSK
ncbi:MAG TPA: head GIN domain-containing protein [Bacteroidales bacterium]|jgi:hypothetical protein|nr:hypothetical protein [Bacteroidales bacterium]HNR42193.1 head GIN domain-containing protein [Bacteroidales bacterium]HPM17530.1 head GIN domain-containing protein [Bacteroidales bacterium]HQG76970.1 head GIN domain-containing protein [Bacteroidales bacterium]